MAGVIQIKVPGVLPSGTALKALIRHIECGGNLVPPAFMRKQYAATLGISGIGHERRTVPRLDRTSSIGRFIFRKSFDPSGFARGRAGYRSCPALVRATEGGERPDLDGEFH